MQRTIPRVAAVHDISSVGRCSLTVIMPILACMGVQVCPLPTAVLSSHLGGFKEMAFYDFTEHMTKFYRHWRQEGITFDCIYSGFLASAQQIEVVQRFIDEFADSRPLIAVDPVMGDEGKLYSIYDQAMQENMKTLVAKADVITPNYTEACFLLGETYQPLIEEPDSLKDWLKRLAALGPQQVVLTGIPSGEVLVNLVYDRKQDVFWRIDSPYLSARYPGTGDAFASVLLGALLQGHCLEKAVREAAEFVAEAIRVTAVLDTPPREGIALELVLPALVRSSMEAKK